MKRSRMLIALAFGPALFAQSYTFTSLEVPGATQTDATGINNRGTIVGFYFNSPLLHGFALQKGTYTTVDAPGSSLETRLSGINVHGDIVGRYTVTAGPNSHGFILQGSVFTTIDFPGAQQTFASGINSRVEIVGFYLDNNSVDGFLREETSSSRLMSPFQVPAARSHPE